MKELIIRSSGFIVMTVYMINTHIYFGSHLTPHSDAELQSDAMLCIMFILSVYMYRNLKRE